MRRTRPSSVLMIVVSLGLSIGVSVAMDAVLVLHRADVAPAFILVGALLFNATAVVQSGMGTLIEVRRPGHLIGRLMMLAGPMYAMVAAGWLTTSTLQPLVDPGVKRPSTARSGRSGWRSGSGTRDRDPAVRARRVAPARNASRTPDRDDRESRMDRSEVTR